MLNILEDRAEDVLHRRIRIDDATKQASVIDCIRAITRYESNDATKELTRLGAAMGARCPHIRINGKGRETPVANARTLVEIIWLLNVKAAKDFRRQSAHNICRMLGADVSLAREIEERSMTIPQEQKDFFLGPQTTVVATSAALYKRKTMKVGDTEFEVPDENDSPALQERLWSLIDRAGEQQLAASQRALDAEFERRMVVVNEESEQRLAASQRALDAEFERRMVVVNEESEFHLALSRKSQEKKLEEIDRKHELPKAC